MKIGFVVLHYKAYDMTEECIDTLLESFASQEFQVVIVDNGSRNGSGEKLKEKYKKNSQVEVLLNDENLGFANGNNLGYQHIKHKYDPEYIVVMNNDVLIKDSSFLKKIENLYIRTNFSVLGPDIKNPLLKNHQNPNRLVARTYEEVKARYNSFYRRSQMPHIYYLLSVVRRILKPNLSDIENKDYTKELTGVVLHGACLVFSQLFINSRDICFNDKTFLYHEEDILYYECMKAGLKMVYSPEIQVEHYEDVSTNASFKSDFLKMKKRNEWLRDSSKVLMDIMKNE